MKMKKLALFLLLACSLAAPVHAALNASGTLLVLNKSDDTVSLIDLASQKTAATLPTGHGPHEVAVSADGKTAVVTNYGTGDAPGRSVTVIDVPAKTVARTIDLGEYRQPHGIAWLQGNEVAVTVEGSKAVLIVDVAAGKVLQAIPTDQIISHMVAISAKHNRAFIANIGSGSATVIDLEKRAHVTDIATGKGAEGIDVSPDGSEVWVANRASNTVSVIDAATLKITATLEPGETPIRVKFVPGGKHALVSNARSGDVSVFDTATKRRIASIPMQAKAVEGSDQRPGGQFGEGPVPVGILVAPGVPVAFVANTNADIVSVIDLKSWQIVDRLKAGKEPDGLGYSAIKVL
jgi:YVTN family beta-propeller protein